jgi:hypothetical protein
MGERWYLLVAGGAIWAPMIYAAIAHFRKPVAGGCPRCSHSCGVDGKHCEHVDDNNGWSSDRCQCQHDWHWNYESTTATA